MRSFPSRNILLWFMVLALLLSSQERVHGYVWCVEEDGQTRLESALHNSCTADEASAVAGTCAATTGAALTADDSCCGPCLDLAVAPESLQQRSRSNYDLVAPLIPAPVVPVAATQFPPRTLPVHVLPEPRPRIATSLLILRTIVLLI